MGLTEPSLRLLLLNTFETQAGRWLAALDAHRFWKQIPGHERDGMLCGRLAFAGIYHLDPRFGRRAEIVDVRNLHAWIKHRCDAPPHRDFVSSPASDGELAEMPAALQPDG